MTQHALIAVSVVAGDQVTGETKMDAATSAAEQNVTVVDVQGTNVLISNPHMNHDDNTANPPNNTSQSNNNPGSHKITSNYRNAPSASPV